MRYRRFIASAVAFIFVTLVGSSIAFAQAALTDDAHTNNSPKAIDSNYSTNPNIQISSSANAYVKFKISPTLPANTSGSDVARATLKLYIGAVNTPGKVDVFRVTSPWDEATITAVNAPTLGDLVTTSGEINSDKKGKFLAVDVTSAVQQWLGDGTNNSPNYGLALLPHPVDATTPTVISINVDSKENAQTSHDMQLDIQLLSSGSGLTTVAHDATLTGDGTPANLLGIADSGVANVQLANDAVTAEKIASGQVVKSLNALKDDVTLAAGSNITVTPLANTLTIAATGLLSNISHDTTLAGDGTAGSLLRVAVPLTLTSSDPNFTMAVVNSGSGMAINALGPISSSSQYNLGVNRILSAPGLSNTFVGVNSGQALTTGIRNSFFGNFAGSSNTSGINNSFFGYGAGSSNTSGSLNSFFGWGAGQLNTIGSGNAFFGQSAGSKNASGNSNSFYGVSAGFTNTTGSVNAFFGNSAGVQNIDGSFNSFFGSNAGTNNTSGQHNSFFGEFAGGSNTTGQSNTFVGASTGGSNTTETGNTFIGSSSNGAPGITNATAIGFNALVTQSHSLVLGNNVNVGIGTSAPQAKLQVNGGNILINGAGSGLILRSMDGSTCRTVTIDNSGNLVLVPTTCP